MAEAVDLILSITELAGAVIKTGKQLYEIFQDGPKELRAILLETASLRAQLEFVDLFASSSGVASQEDHIKVQIERCQAIMKEIQQLLGRFTLDQSGKGRMSAARLRDGVLQLLRKPEVDQKLKELRCCRESLNSTLVADTWYAFYRALLDKQC